MVRAGKFSARAALLSKGAVLELKLYGAELLSNGCTAQCRILMFSSGNSAIWVSGLACSTGIAICDASA